MKRYTTKYNDPLLKLVLDMDQYCLIIYQGLEIKESTRFVGHPVNDSRDKEMSNLFYNASWENSSM